MNKYKRNLGVFLFFVLINFILFIGIFIKEGIIINRDFNFPVFQENFIRYYYPLWNDMTSQPNFEQIIRLPLRFFLFPLDVSLSLKLLIYFAYLITSLSMYLYLSKIVSQKEQWHIPICGSLAFSFSLPLLQFMGGISLVYSIGVLPLLLWSSHMFNENRNFKWTLLSSLCLLISSTGHPFLLSMNLLLFILYNLLLLDRNWKYLFLTTILFLLYFSWYLIPYALVSLTPTELGREPLAKGTFDVISDNSIFKVLTLARDRFLYIETTPTNEILTNIWYFFLLSPFFIICLPLYSIHKIERKQAKVIFFSFLYLFTTLLSFGSKGIFGEAYWIFVSSTNIGWIFRSPLKFQLYQAFAFSVLFSLGLSVVSKKFTQQKILTITLTTIILVGVNGYTLWYANTKDMTPVSLPIEFHQINDILRSIPDDSKVMWYPRYNEKPTTWLDRPVAPFDIKSSTKDTYSIHQNYNYIEEYLYEKVYPSKLKKTEFYDLLRAIGVKYLVFHNDRNLTLDETALKYIINTLGSQSIIYNSNNWFLFNLSTSNPRVFLTNNIILSENIKLSKYGVILIPDSNLNKMDLSMIKFLEEKNIPDNFKEKNILPNPSFENGTFSWYMPTSTIYKVALSTDAIDGTNSLQISTNNTINRTWLFIKSNEIDVTPKETYMLQTYMKYFNMNGSHIKVEGFDINENKWKDIFFLTKSHFGYCEWQQYLGYLDIPENITKIRIILAAGWVCNPINGTGIVNFDNVGLLSLSEVFPSEKSFKYVNYEKISPTLWKITLNISQPSMLVFTESYDPLWVCYVNGEKINSIPLYGVINGFYINQTGLLEITIEYEPQKWFYIGSIISLTTFITCTAYLTLTHPKTKHTLQKLKQKLKTKKKSRGGLPTLNKNPPKPKYSQQQNNP